MVMTWMLPAREFLGLKHVVTLKHLENMAKVMLVTGMMVTYGYAMEHFIAWYSGNPYEYSEFFRVRQHGPMAPIYWLMMFCNCVVPQIFWSKRARTNVLVLWFASILINVGMWCERFTIVITSLHRDFIPSQLGELLADLGRHQPVHRDDRPLLHAVPAVPQVRAGRRRHRDQGAAPRAGA